MNKNQISLLNIVLILFVVLCISPAVFSEGKLKEREWYGKALKYIEDYELMVDNISKNKSDAFLEDFTSVHNAKIELINAPAPTEMELKELLNSSDNLERKVALVNILTRKVYSQGLFDSIVAVNKTREIYFDKVFSYQALAALQMENLDEIENELIEAVMWEADKSLVIRIMPILIKLDPQKVLPYFLNIMRTDSKSIKRITAVYLIEMGSENVEKVKDILKEENNIEALEIIQSLEKGEKP